MDPYFPQQITRYHNGARHPATVQAIRETPLRLVLDGREVVTLLCSGMHPRFLAVGHLFSCGLIDTAQDIAGITVTEADDQIDVAVTLCDHARNVRSRAVTVTSGLGRTISAARAAPQALLAPPASSWLRPQDLIRLAAELQARSELYRLTRGCHNSSLCAPHEMRIFRSDIGRHNAIDTIVGQCLLEGVCVDNCLIVTTGRIASEIVHKAVRAGIGALVSSAVATALAVEAAKRSGLTLVGNVGDDGFWIYNDTGRLAEG